MKSKNNQGSITPFVLVLTSVMIIVIYGLLYLLVMQLELSQRRVASEEALNIAEAGVNYYRWHLAHDPDDFYDGTGSPGVYVHTYTDPQGGEVGTFALEITEPQEGSSIVTIKSTGKSNNYPNLERSIITQYGKPSLAQFSFLMNASSWYGSGITVHGKIHSNNGIRMDGTNTGQVTSAKETYTCGSETGCSPPSTRPGVWGSGGNQSLWDFPVPPIDFNSISFDFASMRTASQSNGLYLPNTSDAGYHLVFDANGTVNVYRVTSTRYYNGYDGDEGCHRLYQRIRNETLMGTYDLSTTPIIFAEDHLWVEGTIDGSTTVVAARFPIESYETNIWINNNIVYETYDNSDALGLIAQNDIYFARDIPNDFIVDGAIMAQTGKIIRHGYFWWCGGTSNAMRNSLTIHGAIMSYNKSYWNYGSSGFVSREIHYDTHLLYSPPPYFPTTGEYEFISWKEE